MRAAVQSIVLLVFFFRVAQTGVGNCWFAPCSQVEMASLVLAVDEKGKEGKKKEEKRGEEGSRNNKTTKKE